MISRAEIDLMMLGFKVLNDEINTSAILTNAFYTNPRTTRKPMLFEIKYITPNSTTRRIVEKLNQHRSLINFENTSETQRFFLITYFIHNQL